MPQNVKNITCVVIKQYQLKEKDRLNNLSNRKGYEEVTEDESSS
jgi:hypothetical protein